MSSEVMESPWSNTPTDQLALANQIALNSKLDTKPGSINYFEKLAETRSKSNDVYTDLLVEAEFERARRQLDSRASLMKVKVKERVRKDEEIQLRRDFSMFELDFTDAKDESGHAFYRCHRRLSVLFLKWKARISKNSKPSNGYDVVWKDVGGNPVSHLNLNDFWCHTCAPLIDHNDNIRHSNFKEHLRRMNVTGPLSGLYKEYVDRKSRVICNRKAQFCTIAAEVLFFIHSSYDITLEEMATAMARSRAFVAYGCFHFHPDVINNDFGSLSNGLNYRKFIKYGRMRIRFWFTGDVQNGYDHDWLNYISLVRSHRISAVVNGVPNYYNVQIEAMMSNVVFFKLSRCENGSIPESNVFRVFTDDMLDDKLVIYHHQWKTLIKSKFTNFDDDHMALQRLVVPRKLYERGYQYASNLPETRFTFQNIEIALSSFNTREIVSGQVVSVDPIHPRDVKSLARIIYVQVFIDNYENSKTVKKLLGDEKRVRDNVDRSFISRYFSNGFKSTSKVRDFPKTDVEFVDEQPKGFFSRIISSILESAEITRKFDTYISDKFAKFLTFEEELDMLLLDEESNDRGFTNSDCCVNYGDFQKVKALMFEPLSVEKDPCLNLNLRDLKSEFCSADLRVKKNDSDGNCVFQSIIDAGLWDKDVVSLRRFLRSSRQIHQLECRETLLKDLAVEDGSAEGHCSMDLYILVAMVFQVRVCVHRYESQYRFGTGKLYHFCLENRHAEALLPYADLDDPIAYDPAVVYEEDESFRCKFKAIYAGQSRSKVDKTFTKVKRGIFPLSDLGKCGYEFPTAVEMAELNLRFSFTGELAFVYGPHSGYVEYLLDRSWNVVNSNDSKRLGVVPRFDNDNYEYVYGSHLTGALDSESQILSVANHALRKRQKGFDLFVGCSSRPCFRKPFTEKVFKSEKELMEIVLRKHGDAVFRVSSDIESDVYKMLEQEFESVQLIRLEVVNPLDPVFFMICRGYNGSVVNEAELDSNVSNFCNKIMLKSVQTFDSVYSLLECGSNVQIACNEDVLESYRNAFALTSQSKFGIRRNEIVESCILELFSRTRDQLRSKMEACEYKDTISTIDDYDEVTGSDSALVLQDSCFDVLDESFDVPLFPETPEVVVKAKSFGRRFRSSIKKKTSKIFSKPVFAHSDGLTVSGTSNPTGISLPVWEVDDVCVDPVVVVDEDVQDDSNSSASSVVAEVIGKPTEVRSDVHVDKPTTSARAVGRVDKMTLEARKAMKEYLALCRHELDVEISNHRRIAEKLSRQLPLKTVVRNEVGGYGICEYLDHGSWEFVVRPDSECNEWNKFYHDGKFHNFEDIANVLTYGTHFVVSDFTSVCLHDDVLKSLKSFEIEKFVLPEDLSIVQAAPGCGKTTFIVNNCDPWTSVSPSTVILSTVEGKMDFISRIEKRTGLDCDDKNSKYYRTMMSYLINLGRTTDSLFIDEALMSHPGQVFFAIYISGASSVKCLGDVCQIPFVNRTPTFDAKYISLTSIVPVGEVLYKSYRCPADVCRRLNEHYLAVNSQNNFPYGMHSMKTSLENTCIVKRIPNSNFPIEPAKQYLVFTQAEKQILRSKGLKVSTIHEFQGKESEHIVVVRLNDKKMSDIYLRFNYALVALTRHTKSLVYYTRYDGDALSKLIGVDGVRRLFKHTDDEIGEVVEKFGALNGISKFVSVGSVQSLTYVRSNPGVPEVIPVSRKFGSNFDGHTVAIVSKNGNSDDLSLRMIRNSIQEVVSVHGIFEKVCLRNSFLSYFSPEVLSFTFRKLGLKVFILSDDYPEDIPYQVFEFTCKNGIYQDFSEEYLEEDLWEPELNFPKSVSLPFDVSMAQEFLDEVFGETNYFSREHDAWLANTGTLDINIGNIRFDPVNNRILPFRSVNAKPVLQTTLGSLREYTLREYLLAIEKRNRNVPLMSGVVDISSTASKMCTNMFGRVIDPDLFYSKLKDITVSSYSIMKWMNKQETSVLDKIVPEFAIHDSAVCEYNFSIKRRAKPVLTCDAHDTYAALQTIVYHEKHINAAFCSIFSQIADLITGSLLPNVLLFTGMSTADFQNKVTSILNNRSGFDSLEIDISKYDKSQGAIALEFECKLMELCGVDPYWVKLWYNAHILTYIYDRRTKVSFTVPYQRKSGDASTFIGNTVFLMAVICDQIPIEKMDFACFSGDDSLILGDIKDEWKVSSHYSLKFNLEVKFFSFDNYYFCSKFLVEVGGRYYFVPDPLKLFVKFGRDDLVDKQHLMEYRISLADNCSSYSSIGVAEAVAISVTERYGVGDYSNLFRMIPSLLADDDAFSVLFTDVVEKSGNVRRDFD